MDVNRKLIESLGQTFVQLKQTTHRLKSISFVIFSIHSALETRSHKPHPTQLDLSILSLKKVNFEINPSKVPTGQTVLQYNLPLLYARYITIIKNNSGNKAAIK